MNTSIPHKQCNRCGNVFPLTEEFWYPDKSKSIGFSTPCRACRLAKVNEYSKEHRAEIATKSRDWRENNHDRHREYSREWAKTHPKQRDIQRRDYKVNNPDKIIAHRAIRNAIKRGAMPKAKALMCADCGGQAKEYHHPDYSLVMYVIPLCQPCHRKRHRKQYE